jgi:hypothetical protein
MFNSRRHGTLFTGLKGIVQLEKTGVKAGINISTSNSFFCLFCPLGSDREVTGVISVHAQYRCNEPFIAIYKPMVYCTCICMATHVILLMRANPLRGQVREGLGPGNHDFLGLAKWHRAVRRVRFGAQKS